MSLCRLVFGGLLLTLLAAVPSQDTHAQLEMPEVLQADGFVSVDRAARGSSFRIAVDVRVTPPWHVNAHVPTDEFLVPTELVLEGTPGITIGRTVYPPAREVSFAFSDRALAVYEGGFVIGATGTVSEEAALGEGRIRGTLHYQACNDETCLPPTSVDLDIPIEIVPAGMAVARVHDEVFARMPADEPARTTQEEPGLAKQIRERGLLFVLIMVFGWGLALNLTPCVFPMIPLTIGYFGAQAKGHLASRIQLAFFYFLGIAIMYSTLGVVAAATGGLFGAALQNPLVMVAVAAILVLLSFNMFGFYEIRLPGALMRVGGGSRQGLLGALVMGLTVGIVAAPCVGAVVVALLLYVMESGDLFLGFWLFFALSCGLGLPFLVLAVFSSSISSLPRSGEWMTWVKRLFGILLVGMAIYFLRPILPPAVGHYLLPLTAVIGGIYLGFIDRTQSASRGFSWVKRGVGIIGILVAVWLLMPQADVPGVSWKPYGEDIFDRARSGGKPVVIDFTAEWCIACRELDRYTFSDPRVVQTMQGAEALQVDLTRSGDAVAQAVKERYRVVGMPTIVFIDASGREAEDLRVEGFVEADDFLARLEGLLAD